MPVDTAQKRFSITHILCAWRGLKVVPSAGVNQADRQAFQFMYSGILWDPPSDEVDNIAVKLLLLYGDIYGPSYPKRRRV